MLQLSQTQIQKYFNIAKCTNEALCAVRDFLKLEAESALGRNQE